MPDGGFTVQLVSGVPVVAAPQEIDINNAPQLCAALQAAAASGPATIVADMTRTRFCDSSGLHALVAAHQSAQDEGRELLLVISCAAVLRIFAITGVDRVIPNFASLDEALARTPPNASNGHRTADDGPEGSAGKPAGRTVVTEMADWAGKRAERRPARSRQRHAFRGQEPQLLPRGEGTPGPP